MPKLYRRWILIVVLAYVLFFFGLSLLAQPKSRDGHSSLYRLLVTSKFDWKALPLQHPIEKQIPLPSSHSSPIPRIQHDFPLETHEEKIVRQERLAAVKEAFMHSWEGYKNNAWMQDEVAPLSGVWKNGFGGWGATLVDSLDTLWIMGLKKEFSIAVHEVGKIDFTSTPLKTLNVFETTIRYLGGLLSAYDVSGHKHPILLKKAVELGNMLYMAFDTPNRMPVTRWDWKNTAHGGSQLSDRHSLLAEVGSMTLEFTRLSQLTGDPKWYDAVARVMDVMEEQQNNTKIPGLWPVYLDTLNNNFHVDITFSIGGMADSTYEYLPKQHLLLGGQSTQYHNMYSTALPALKKHIFFRPLTPHNQTMLIAGTVRRHSARRMDIIPEGQHLTCFAGGMVALAAKVFDEPHDLETARQLLDGCMWAYDSMPSGIMPELFTAAPCAHDEAADDCAWSEERWWKAVATHDNHGELPINAPLERAKKIVTDNKLAPGFTEINDPRYILRPEAIESVFVLYRITGDEALREQAWKMFQAIINATKTSIAYASVNDVTADKLTLYDSMESFWTAETLKYFYLIFSEPDMISLDDYVFNTEAHPLLRPKQPN